jgi:hypothetical protein
MVIGSMAVLQTVSKAEYGMLQLKDFVKIILTRWAGHACCRKHDKVLSLNGCLLHCLATRM